MKLGFKRIIALLLIGTIVSCEKHGFTERKAENNKEGVVLENSYLSFSSNAEFEKYLDEVSSMLNNNTRLKSSSVVNQPIGFYSLADKIADADQTSLKSGGGNNVDYEKLFEAELLRDLIPDNILHYALDAENRVKINGKIYQITELGTFIYEPSEKDNFDIFCETFIDNYTKYDSKSGNVYTYGSFTFIDTYKHIEHATMNEALDLLVSDLAWDGNENVEDQGAYLKSSAGKINTAYTSTYNLTTHNAARHTIIGKPIDNLSGKWFKRSIGSRYRIKCKLYTVDYGFYKNSGFKTKFQIQQVKTITIGWGRWKKKITIRGLWIKKDAPKMVVGIDHFKGYTEMTTFGLDKYYNDNYDEIADHSKKWSNQFVKMVYAGFLKDASNVAKGWVSSRINMFDATSTIEILGNTYNLSYYERKAFEEAFDKARDEGIKQLKKKSYSFVYNQLGGDVNKPKVLFVPGGGGYSNREYLVLEGVSPYTNKDEVKTNFGAPSFGLKLGWSSGSGWGMPSGFTPNKFVVEEAYVFGSVYYGGKWTGIRLYLD